MIRPQSARWFEIVVARDDAFIALEALAASGCVEIETRADAPVAPAGATAAALSAYGALAARYRPYWPAAAARPAPGRRLRGPSAWRRESAPWPPASRRPP